MINEKRRFQRIPFDATAAVSLNGNLLTTGTLKDISLKGALILFTQTDSLPDQDTVCDIIITSDQGQFTIEFNAKVCYLNQNLNTIGVNILKMEVDSATHLRRLVEVNLGNEEELQRELTNLIDAMESEHLS